MTLRFNNLDELQASLGKERADKIAPAVELKRYKKNRQQKQTDDDKWTDRPAHVYFLVGIVSGFCYLLMGIGWLIEHTGRAMFEIGRKGHEAKWNIR